jgi:ribose 5-phosphate isomerase A
MKERTGSEVAKRAAGEHAATQVEEGMCVGLGTGSTAAHAIRALGHRAANGLTVQGIPTSLGARAIAREAGLSLTDLDEGLPDLVIDGADQVEQAGTALIKGGGAAHTREKVVATAADRVVIVIDETKLVDRLNRSIPLEVLPAAQPVVAREIRSIGGEPSLRAARAKDGPVVTDNGNLVVDCAFGPIDDPETLAGMLAAMPGVVEHGLFCDVGDELIVGTETGVSVESFPLESHEGR